MTYDLKNGTDLRIIAKRIEEAVRTAIPELQFKLGNIRYEADGTSFTTALKVSQKGIDPDRMREERDLRMIAPIDGVDCNMVDALGWKLVGYRSKAQKMPYIIANKTGERRIIPTAAAIKRFPLVKAVQS